MTKQKNQQMGCGVGKQKRRNLFNAIKIYGFQLTIRKKLVYTYLYFCKTENFRQSSQFDVSRSSKMASGSKGPRRNMAQD